MTARVDTARKRKPRQQRGRGALRWNQRIYAAWKQTSRKRLSVSDDLSSGRDPHDGCHEDAVACSPLKDTARIMLIICCWDKNRDKANRLKPNEKTCLFNWRQKSQKVVILGENETEVSAWLYMIRDKVRINVFVLYSDVNYFLWIYILFYNISVYNPALDVWCRYDLINGFYDLRAATECYRVDLTLVFHLISPQLYAPEIHERKRNSLNI